MLSKLSYLNSNIALTLGYLNPALNNSALVLKYYFWVLFFLVFCELLSSYIRLSIVNYNKSIEILYYYVGMLVLRSSSLFCHAVLL